MGRLDADRYDDIVAAPRARHIHAQHHRRRHHHLVEGSYAGVAAPPITSDPPEHHWHRRTILPTFAPQAVAKYEDGTRALCNQLIDGFIDAGQADAATDYAQQIPVRVIATMLGVPLEMADEFTSWVRGVLEIGLMDPKVRLENRMKILGYFRAQLDDRKANPRDDDLITDLLNTRVDGELVSEDYVMGVCNLMLVAGIDTTWSAIGSSLGIWRSILTTSAPRPAEIWPTATKSLHGLFRR
jgi:cytochrome P450